MISSETNTNLLLFIGDDKKQVHMEGYSVSAQCMALVRDNCLVPTKDSPELGYIRESSDKQYVPDVYYKVGTLTFYFTYIFLAMHLIAQLCWYTFEIDNKLTICRYSKIAQFQIDYAYANDCQPNDSINKMK